MLKATLKTEPKAEPRKVLLVNPRTPDGCGKSYYLPLGLLYLASICEKSGCVAELLDFNIHAQNNLNSSNDWCNQLLINKIQEYKPDFVLLGCLFSGQFDQVRKIAQTIKRLLPGARTLLGGIHATSYPFEILSHCPSIDYIVIGEGENTLESFLKKDGQRDADYHDLDGFAFRTKTGSVIVNKKTRFIDTLDEIPFPAYHLINIEDYYIDTQGWHNPKKMRIKASLPIITSRGCPMRCSFCPMSSVMGKQYRHRSVENVFSELLFLYTKYGHSYFSFMDDNFTLNREFILQLCHAIIDNGLNIQFDTLNGIAVNSLDEEVIDALVRAGLVRTALAIESGSPVIRKCMGKNLSQEKIFEVVKIFKKYPSVFIRGFFIIGMPEETHDTLRQTYEMIRCIDIHSSEVNNLVPFPGTKLFDQALRDNLFFDETDLDDLWKTTYVMSKRDYFIVKPYHLNLGELKKWRSEFDKLSEREKKLQPLSQSHKIN